MNTRGPIRQLTICDIRLDYIDRDGRIFVSADDLLALFANTGSTLMGAELAKERQAAIEVIRLESAAARACFDS